MELRDLAPAGIAIIVAAIVLGIGGDIIQSLRDKYAGTTESYAIANYSLYGLDELGSWLPTIGLVIAAGLVIGIVVASFAFRR